MIFLACLMLILGFLSLGCSTVKGKYRALHVVNCACNLGGAFVIFTL